MQAKIKGLKSIEDVKQTYKFIVDNFKESLKEDYLEDFSLMSTYKKMMQLLEDKKGFQFKAEIYGVVVGAVVAYYDQFHNDSISIATIVVKKPFQKQGIARQLLKKLETQAKKKGYTRIKIKETERANGFFIRNGYIPYLYAFAKSEEDVETLKEQNIRNFKVLEQIPLEKEILLRMDVDEEIVYRDKKHFNKISKNISAEYIFEKKLNKI